MNSTVSATLSHLLNNRTYSWLVTGGAGFIGSHIADALIDLRQTVHVVDNLSTGSLQNIEYLKNKAESYGVSFTFHRIDINQFEELSILCGAVDKIIHQAALGSVPRSVADPFSSHTSNVSGFLHVLNSALKNNISRVVYASSSSVYGDLVQSPKVEDRIGKVLSPYAATKLSDEIYADAYSNSYGIELVGLRYFNVFGARQDPEGPYAAVIPRWIDAIQRGQQCEIYGDGETSRDFCYIDNVVYANVASALTERLEKKHTVLNVACGESTSLNQLYEIISEAISARIKKSVLPPVYKDFRVGDIRHSLADVSKARELIGYDAFVKVKEGLAITVSAYMD